VVATGGGASSRTTTSTRSSSSPTPCGSTVWGRTFDTVLDGVRSADRPHFGDESRGVIRGVKRGQTEPNAALPEVGPFPQSEATPGSKSHLAESENHASHARGRWFETSRAHPVPRCRAKYRSVVRNQFQIWLYSSNRRTAASPAKKIPFERPNQAASVES
jgi:hypothetical protein